MQYPLIAITTILWLGLLATALALLFLWRSTNRLLRLREAEIERLLNKSADERAAHEIALAAMRKEVSKEAIKRSAKVIRGQVAEQLIALTSLFPFNPKDARFLGAPVDYIVFDGLIEKDLAQIGFIEVKTGESALSWRERAIRDCIQRGDVFFEVIRIPIEEVEDGTEQSTDS